MLLRFDILYYFCAIS